MIAKSDLKYIQSLAHKKFRDQEGCFVQEGDKMVGQTLVTFPEQLLKVFATEKWLKEHASTLPVGMTAVLVHDFEMEKISFLTTPSQVLALVRLPVNNLVNLDRSASMVLLDHLQDPGNLGTMIRSCDWFGITQVVCSPHTVDAFNPKVVQSAMGSVLRVRIFYTDLRELLDAGLGMPVFAAVLEGQNVFQVQVKSPFALLVGNESRGVSTDLQHLASSTVMIPRIGHAESLNASVAAAVILSAFTKQAVVAD